MFCSFLGPSPRMQYLSKIADLGELLSCKQTSIFTVLFRVEIFFECVSFLKFVIFYSRQWNAIYSRYSSHWNSGYGQVNSLFTIKILYCKIVRCTEVLKYFCQTVSQQQKKVSFSSACHPSQESFWGFNSKMATTVTIKLLLFGYEYLRRPWRLDSLISPFV